MANTDKIVYLPQLQRYDEKFRRWVNGEFLAKTDTVVSDVRLNDESITENGVVNIPIATTERIGVTKYDPYGGLSTTERGWGISSASKTQIDARNASHYPIVADSQFDYAVKAAMCDGKGAAWTAEEQAAAKERMGIGDYSLPKATATTLGVVKIGTGLSVATDGTASVNETYVDGRVTAIGDKKYALKADMLGVATNEDIDAMFAPT